MRIFEDWFFYFIPDLTFFMITIPSWFLFVWGNKNHFKENKKNFVGIPFDRLNITF
jgi:hypothetical protein